MKNSLSNKIQLKFGKAFFGLILLFLFLNSCGSYTRNLETQKTEIETFTPPYLENFTEESFKVSIEAFGNHFGGIMLAKRMGENHYRFAMINEFGGKLLDFELINQELKLNYAIDQLDRKMLLNLLEKDFSMIFSEKNWVLNSYKKDNGNLVQTEQNIYYFLENENLKKIEFAKKKVKTIVEIHSNGSKIPNFDIHHQNLPIKIFLHLLSDQTPIGI